MKINLTKLLARLPDSIRPKGTTGDWALRADENRDRTSMETAYAFELEKADDNEGMPSDS